MLGGDDGQRTSVSGGRASGRPPRMPHTTQVSQQPAVGVGNPLYDHGAQHDDGGDDGGGRGIHKGGVVDGNGWVPYAGVSVSAGDTHAQQLLLRTSDSSV